MFGNRSDQVSTKANFASLAVCLLGGVLLLHNPATVVGQLMEIGVPERVFSMDDFSSIPNKNINFVDITNDGGIVAFSTFPGGGLYVYQTDGEAGDPVLIGPPLGPGTITQTMRFSRDDTKLFYSWDGPETSGYDIWVANTDGSDASEFAAGAGTQGHPTPVVVNGECRLLYREGHWPLDLWSSDCTGGDRIRLTFEGNKSTPSASVDGTRVVYMSQDTARCHDIFLMNSDGSEQRPITNDGPAIQECYPVLANNHLGDEVVLYVRGDPSTGKEDIWVTDLDGMQHEPLITGQDRYLRIAYAPNDPISPYGVIYYKIITASSAAFELWRVAIGTNVAPTCDAGVPYSIECEGVTTDITLDGTPSTDPDGDSLDFAWSTDCPGGFFDDPGSAAPTLTVDTSDACDVTCNVSLIVDDGNGGTSECSTTVTIEDTTPPVVTCSATALNGQRMLIEYDAWDACGDVTGSAVIQTACCPLPVGNGQVVKVKCRDHEECTLKVDFEDEVFEIKTNAAGLVVTATDECGNEATCTVELCAPGED